MFLKSFGIVAIGFVVYSASGMPSAQASDCGAGAKVDGSTADTAKKKMEKAGYHQVHALKKGCDNFWHGKSGPDAEAINIVLSPQGDVLVEGD